jgi:hypothetical protein
MKRGNWNRVASVLTALVLAIGVGGADHSAVAQDNQQSPDLVIHEWGTFLGMSGSDGSALEGMYHEEHALPAFVHARSRDQLRVPSASVKGETPVIYFYTDRPQSVRVGVGFPSGVWTQWYPQAARVSPDVADQAGMSDRLRDGRICWYADIIPPSLVDPPSLPATSSDALWNHARQVDACFVRTIDGARDPQAPDYERFLFYRGLGESRLPLRLSARNGGTMTLDRDPTLEGGVQHLYVIRVEHGRGVFRYIPELRPGEAVSDVIPSLEGARPLAQFATAIADNLAGRLTESGLFAKEARAMVNTWNLSYFQSEGIRVLFVLPQSWTDAFIPMSVHPQPKEIVRVMVGRLELLSPEREQRAEAAIRSLADPDDARRAPAFAYLREQGRYVEPIIRRVLKTTRDDSIRLLCHRLLLTDLVTDLRAAIHHAADGKRLDIDAILLRAQLGRLLREIGLDREARAEGVAVLRDLDRVRAATAFKDPAELERRDIRAAALEATGIDRSAVAVYDECIRTQAAAFGDTIGPANTAFYRDWWVGRAYARSMVRLGTAEPARRELERKLGGRAGGDGLSRLEKRSSTMLLAYLHEAQGDHRRAEQLWLSLEGTNPAAEPRVVSLPASL